MVTAYDVAALAGVSVGTVSRYLTGNGYVGTATQQRIAAAIAELGFIPNKAAASLKTKITGLLGFVVSDLRNPFSAEIASALSQAARSAGYGLILSESANDAEVATRAVESMRAHGVDGLIVTPPESPGLNRALQLAVKSIPVVGIGLRTHPLATDLVTSDTQDGAHQAVSHLIGLGHRHIGYIGSATMASGRYRGYLDAHHAAGLDVDPGLVRVGHLDRGAGIEAFEELRAHDPQPTAIFGANDAVALGVLQAAHAAGVAVPSELSVVGYDGVDLSAHSVPPLTTFAQPMAAMGAAAVRLILGRLDGGAAMHAEPQEITLAGEFIVRESTARNPKKGNVA